MATFTVAHATVIVLALGLSGCSPSSGGTTTPQLNTAPSWGFPFKTGTKVTLGALGLHDDNFNSTPGQSGTITLRGAGNNPNAATNPGVPDASLDLLPAQPNTPVIPEVPGTIISVWPLCHLVLIDLGNGTWVEYLHVKVDPSLSFGESVTRDTVLGTTTTEITTGSPCYETFDGSAPVDHVHFAFLQGSGTTGTFVSMVDRMLCGYRVNSSSATADAPEGGAIEGLADVPGASFTVPNCSSSPTASTPSPAPQGGTLLWRYQTGKYIWSSPAISNGIVYIGSNDDFVYALDSRSGALRWRYQTGGGTRSSPVVVNGIVYIGSNDDFVYALDADSGTLHWRYQTGNKVISWPAIATRVVYVGSIDGFLYVLAT